MWGEVEIITFYIENIMEYLDDLNYKGTIPYT